MIGMRAQTNAERQRRWRERQNQKRASSAQRRDGEGITLADGSHVYVTFQFREKHVKVIIGTVEDGNGPSI